MEEKSIVCVFIIKEFHLVNFTQFFYLSIMAKTKCYLANNKDVKQRNTECFYARVVRTHEIKIFRQGLSLFHVLFMRRYQVFLALLCNNE